MESAPEVYPPWAFVAQDRVVVTLLKQERLTSISQRLDGSGIDFDGAIKWGAYRPFTVENTLPLLTSNGRLAPVRFITLFEPILDTRSGTPRENVSSVLVLAELASVLMGLGYGQENAL